MKFIDFFAGIGGIRLGLERAGHECVGFCEFDKFARQSYKAIHNTNNEWEAHDVRTVNSTDVPKADLWCFGFPCQDLSVAGKQKGLQAGERSGLFYEIMRLLAGLQKEDRPKYLLVENVKNLLSIGGGFDFLRLLVEMGGHGYDVEWQVLNSKDFGVPQNRERVFLVGHLGGASGREVFPLRRTDGENPCTSTEQRPLRLGNIYGRDKGTSFAGNVWDKTHISPTLDTAQGGNRMPLILDEHPQGLDVGGDIKLIGNYMPSGHSAGRVVDPKGIAPTVMDNYGLASAVAIDMTENKPAITDNVRCLKARYTAGITNRSGDNSGVLVKPVLTPDREEKRQNGRRMKEDGEPMFTLTAQDRHGVAINTRIRKLTPRECWRLQGFPDECFDRAKWYNKEEADEILKKYPHTNKKAHRQFTKDQRLERMSDSQLYKQAGNAVTVNVAEAIGKRLKEIEVSEGEREKNQAL